MLWLPQGKSYLIHHWSVSVLWPGISRLLRTQEQEPHSSIYTVFASEQRWSAVAVGQGVGVKTVALID